MKHHSFDMNLLTVFNAIAEEKSVTLAGERLGRTQSAISNSLKKLRDVMHDPLFVRGANGLVLTPKAVALQDQVLAIIQTTELCLTETGAFDPGSARGTYRIGAPDRLTLPVMLPLLKALQAEAPGMAADILTVDRETALVLIDEDRVDMAIGWFDNPPPRFSAMFLFHEPLVCLCRKTHPLVKRTKVVDLETVLSYPHLVVSSTRDQRAAFDIMLAQLGLKRQAMVSMQNFSMVPEVLLNSDLVGIYTKRIADLLAGEFDLAVRALPAALEPLDHFLIWHSRHDSDLRHAWLRDRIAKLCGV